MRKTTPRKTGKSQINKRENNRWSSLPAQAGEKIIDEVTQVDTTKNQSQAEDRGEDLINETDPFIQQDEKETQIPPELIQQRAYYFFEQRGYHHGGDLADWFEAERQLREKRNLL